MIANRYQRFGWSILLLLIAALGAVFVLRPPVPAVEKQAPSVERAPSQGDSTLAAVTTTGQSLDDPSSDGWATEEFQLQAAQQLKSLWNLLSENRSLHPQDTAPFVANNFACSDLGPAHLQTVFGDTTLDIRRFAPTTTPDENRNAATHSLDNDPTSRIYLGAEGFAKAITALQTSFGASEKIRFEVKIVHVEILDDMVFTRQFLACTGGVFEQHAT